MGVPRPWARQPPPGGMRPTFLTSRWIMWPGKRARIGLLTRLVCPVGPGVAASVQAGSVQPSDHGTHRHHCPAHSQLVADTAGGPLVGTTPSPSTPNPVYITPKDLIDGLSSALMTPEERWSSWSLFSTMAMNCVIHAMKARKQFMCDIRSGSADSSVV